MILTGNAGGSFALLGISSRYEGVFFWHQGEMFRTIAGFDVNGDGSVLNELWKVSRSRGKVQESVWFAHRLPVFFYELSKPASVGIVFDCKKNYDNRVWGRQYGFFVEDGVLFVRFEKKNDGREGAGHGEYGCWLALHGCEFEIINKWEEQKYSYDEQRQSPPFNRWVVRGCRAKGSFAIAFGKEKHEAAKLAKESWERKDALAKEAREFAAGCLEGAKGKNEARLAMECALYSLACLQETGGLFAGLPWFHQRWARDELISVKGLLLSGQESLARVILFSWLEKVLPGKLPGTLTNTIADGGWLFVRLEQYLSRLTVKEKKRVLEKLDAFLGGLAMKDGLVHNGAQETWMDSLERSGARLEIQALTLAACRLRKKLAKAHPLEAKLKKRAREAFWNGRYLKDGADDGAIRPNIFVAAYAYPELLTKAQWKKCFDTVLPRLWCEWGGLASLDKNNPGFVPVHTGENPKSYHNGDSWFWVNNLAALVLHRLDAERYGTYVRHIVDAGVKEILYNGAFGHHAELSSASRFESAGSPVQAWSAALFVELVAELEK